MYKRNGIKKLGRTKSHRDALIKNQIRSLLRAGSIKTTTPKAKVLKKEVSKFVTKVSKISDKVLFNRTVEEYVGKGKAKEELQKLLDSKNLTVAIVKIGFRAGDNAEVSKVTLPALMESKKKVTKAAPKKAKAEKPAEEEAKQDEPKKKGFLNREKRTDTAVDSKGHAEAGRARSRSGL